MFAGAAREVVFANREFVDRINKEFIPVALKAALVNNPPHGVEGGLYAEIGRSKPAPQGICTLHSNGKVLCWALSFDDDASILKFLDHVASRYKQASAADRPIVAERFMTFPGRKLDDIEDNGKSLEIPANHAKHERCPAKPALQKGTLVGRVIGRPLGVDGKPVERTLRQEDYIEARFEIPVAQQEQFALAARRANGKEFPIPNEFARSLVSPAFLGQLDVNPLGDVPGSRNGSSHWAFRGQAVDSQQPGIVRVRLVGESEVKGHQDSRRNPTGDGRLWEHSVALDWQGYVDVKGNLVVQLVMLADGNEKLRWGNDRFNFLGKSAASHLMAGHRIDFDGPVRYGLIAQPCPADEIVEDAKGNAAPTARLQRKMKRFQAGMQRLQKAGGDPSRIAGIMKEVRPVDAAGQVQGG